MSGRTNVRAYLLLRHLVRAAFAILCQCQVTGLENVPPRGPYLLIANHLSAFDPPLIMAVIPAPVMVFAASTHRHDFILGELMDQIGAIWVQRGEVDRQALRTALQVLETGNVLGMAPEGTRSKTGALQQGKVGVAYLATRANVPLLPMAITGTEAVARKLKRLQRPKLTVTIGPLFRLPENERASTAELERYTEQIMHTLAAMLPQEYRGVYQ